MPKFIDLTGKKFGKWTIIKKSEFKGKSIKWICQCECGNIKEILRGDIKNGHSKSCGCSKKSSHPFGPYFTEHPLYEIWSTIKKRCLSQSFSQYKRYGARGITICDEWKNSFSKFLEDMGNRPEGLTIERINNDGPYAPWNCKWATHKEQQRNMRSNVYLTAEGKTMIQKDWAIELNIDARYIYTKLKKGKSMDEIIKYYRR